MKLYEYVDFENRSRVENDTKSKLIRFPLVFINWIGIIFYSVICIFWCSTVGFLVVVIELLVNGDVDSFVCIFEMLINAILLPSHFWYRYIKYGEYGMYGEL